MRRFAVTEMRTADSPSTTRRHPWRAWPRSTAFGAAIAASLALAVPPASAEGCASTCSVGGAGTGGVNSDGKAGGFRLEGPATRFPGSTFTNSGNQNAGHITIQGTAEGSASGAFTPQGVVVGHYDGVVAGLFGIDGTCSGVCG
jgi:hypothetical protein